MTAVHQQFGELIWPYVMMCCDVFLSVPHIGRSLAITYLQELAHDQLTSSFKKVMGLRIITKSINDCDLSVDLLQRHHL